MTIVWYHGLVNGKVSGYREVDKASLVDHNKEVSDLCQFVGAIDAGVVIKMQIPEVVFKSLAAHGTADSFIAYITAFLPVHAAAW